MGTQSINQNLHVNDNSRKSHDIVRTKTFYDISAAHVRTIVVGVGTASV
mgnify:CR=1 FL=1